MANLGKFLFGSAVLGAVAATGAMLSKKKKAEAVPETENGEINSDAILIISVIFNAMSIHKNPTIPGLQIKVYDENGNFDFDDYIDIFDAVPVSAIKKEFEDYFGKNACCLSDLEYDEINLKKYLKYMQNREK